MTDNQTDRQPLSILTPTAGLILALAILMFLAFLGDPIHGAYQIQQWLALLIVTISVGIGSIAMYLLIERALFRKNILRLSRASTAMISCVIIILAFFLILMIAAQVIPTKYALLPICMMYIGGGFGIKSLRLSA